jgi:hypothetical protein
LWVREAWGLAVGEDVPLLGETPERQGEPEDRAQWEYFWPELWDAALLHAAAAHGPRKMQQIHDRARRATSDGEREAILQEITGPRWRHRFGDDALGEAFQAWAVARFEARNVARVAARPEAVRDAPERSRVLSALIPAWEHGLQTIVTIPCRGDFAKRLNASTLLVNEAMRESEDRYRDALAMFIADGSDTAGER